MLLNQSISLIQIFFKKMSQKQSNSNNTVSTSSANIYIVIGFQSDTSTSENSEISVSFDSALPCFSKSILQQNRVTLKEPARFVSDMKCLIELVQL